MKKIGKINLIVGILTLSACSSQPRIVYVERMPYGGQAELDAREDARITRLRNRAALEREINYFDEQGVKNMHDAAEGLKELSKLFKQ